MQVLNFLILVLFVLLFYYNLFVLFLEQATEKFRKRAYVFFHILLQHIILKKIQGYFFPVIRAGARKRFFVSIYAHRYSVFPYDEFNFTSPFFFPI